MSVRAVRNNNPGNLNAGIAWQGLMPRAQMTTEQSQEGRFAVFKSSVWGFRALCIVLLNYERVHNLDTIRKMITRWAPNTENDTDAYIKSVCDMTGQDPDAHLDLKDQSLLQSLARAIAVHECGGWFFTVEDLMSGVALAESV
jgi:hypothetical protein